MRESSKEWSNQSWELKVESSVQTWSVTLAIYQVFIVPTSVPYWDRADKFNVSFGVRTWILIRQFVELVWLTLPKKQRLIHNIACLTYHTLKIPRFRSSSLAVGVARMEHFESNFHSYSEFMCGFKIYANCPLSFTSAHSEHWLWGKQLRAGWGGRTWRKLTYYSRILDRGMRIESMPGESAKWTN